MSEDDGLEPIEGITLVFRDRSLGGEENLDPEMIEYVQEHNDGLELVQATFLATSEGETSKPAEEGESEAVARDALATIRGAADDVRSGDDRDDLAEWLDGEADELSARLEGKK